jgi:hypothetical protein
MARAPTAREIIAKSATFCISCDPCAMMTARDDLPARLMVAGKGDWPIDTLKFKCRRCGALGTPWVQGPGNSLMGRERLWPPS